MPHARRAPTPCVPKRDTSARPAWALWRAGTNHEKRTLPLPLARVGHCGFPPHLNPLPRRGEEVFGAIFYIMDGVSPKGLSDTAPKSVTQGFSLDWPPT